MISPKGLIEKLAALEHEQWMTWSKTLAEKEKLSDSRIERWRKLWVPYKELSEQDKEFDREWARKVVHAILNKDFAKFLLRKINAQAMCGIENLSVTNGLVCR